MKNEDVCIVDCDIGGFFNTGVTCDRGFVGKYRKVDCEKGDAAAVRVEAMEDGAVLAMGRDP